MKLYDRAEEKRIKALEDQIENSENYYWNYYDDELTKFLRRDWEDSITLESVRQGWLLTLLAKLRLRSPKDALDELYW